MMTNVIHFKSFWQSLYCYIFNPFGLIITCILLTPKLIECQEDIYQYGTDIDSIHYVQFIALKDTTLSFGGLRLLGNVQKEYVRSSKICRYALGFYTDESDAEHVMNQLKVMGYKDAFIKKKALSPRLKKLPKSNTVYIDGDKSVSVNRNEQSSVETGQNIAKDVLKKDDKNELIVNNSPETYLKYTTEKVVDSTVIDFSMLYTGKSYGTLGYTRFQEEHELATEYAIKKDVEFKLVSHACWRGLGITVFMPSDEPKGDELPIILEKKDQWKLIGSHPALKTKNVILFRDPERQNFDMLNIIMSNNKTLRKFPEIRQVNVDIYKTTIGEDKECIIVQEKNAVWPEHVELWLIGEINRLDFGKTGRMYELPINQGNFSSRATVIKNILLQTPDDHPFTFKADLGHRNGYFGVTNEERALADMRGLDTLGYDFLLPYEFELTLGNNKINQLKRDFPDIKWIVTNINNKEKTLFKPHHIIKHKGIKIGFLGIVDPSLETNLPGKILKTLHFENYLSAVKNGVNYLLNEGVDVTIVFSNMSPADNAILAHNVQGIDILLADFTDNSTPFYQFKEIILRKDQKRGIGPPLLIAQNFNHGTALGKIDFKIQKGTTSLTTKLVSIKEKNYPINDDIPADVALIKGITSGLNFTQIEKGTLMIPSFNDMKVQQPKLEAYDEITKHGRISKGLWEQFLANILKNSAPSEISIIRKIASFPPLIGKLHQKEINSWLRMEDELIIMDMKGRDIRRLMEADQDKSLITSGITSFKTPRATYWFVMGRFLREDVYYRVSTTNIVTNGAFSEHFKWGLRKNQRFTYKPNGFLKSDKAGSLVKLRDFVVSDLKRIRGLGKSTIHHKNIADLFIRPKPYENLFSLKFDKPTLWGSFNKSFKGSGYESVPESRIINRNSLILGVQGGFVLSLDKLKYELTLGTRVAYSQQSADVGADKYQRTETMDDFNIYLTYQYKGTKRKALHPFIRLVYDSEFTPTFNSTLEENNPKQKIIRNILGLSKEFSIKWPVLELGITAENDFSNNHYQFGLQGRSIGRFPLDKNWHVIYSLTNNFNYYLPTKNDTNRELSFKYNMIHEILVPLYGDISLSVAADFFLYRGKTEVNREPGLNMLLRLGFTYNRIWKPKYQKFL
ncbi:MAG: hypothetical protein V3V00_01905 [Saprospiraceae bacterium]